jgi:Mg-chelatase subunit ChlD
VARRLLRQELAKRPNARPFVVVVSDGLPNVPLRQGGDALADAVSEGRALKRAGISCLVLDASTPEQARDSCGAAIAEAAGGVHLTLGEIAPGDFLDVLVRIA